MTVVQGVIEQLQETVANPFEDNKERGMLLFEVKDLLNSYIRTDCNGCEEQDIGFISLYLDAVEQLEEEYTNIIMNLQTVDERQKQLDTFKAEIADYLNPLIKYLRNIDLRVKGAAC